MDIDTEMMKHIKPFTILPDNRNTTDSRNVETVLRWFRFAIKLSCSVP